MRIGLSMYGTTFTMGMHPQAGRRLWTAQEVMEHALSRGLQGVSLPLAVLQAAELATVRRFAEEQGLYITVDTSGYDAGHLTDALQTAAAVGAEVVRTVVGGAKIGGDRRPLAGRWQPFVKDVQAGFTAATLEAERLGVSLAVENHQDLASEELLGLCESIGSTRFGITLDAANPLATAEEPKDFYRRVRTFVKNVHLKDYRIFLSDEGYRLVRCPLGQGVIDFPLLLGILAEGVEADAADGTSTGADGVPLSIELAALEARHIRVLADDFWTDYPPRSAAQFAQVMRFVVRHAEAGVGLDADWRTPYERQATVSDVVAYEERELQESLAYVREIYQEVGHQD